MDKAKILWVSFLLFGFITSKGQNVLISNQSNPNEPSIMMDPKRPNVLIAGANINKYYLSQDTGRTWTTHVLTSPYGVWGDPVIDVDTSGNFYFFHLSNPPSGSGNWIDRIVCQKTTDDGATWSPGTYTGLNGAKAQDKEWSVIDRTNNNIYLTWSQLDDYGSSAAGDSSLIMFSRSFDGGDTWSPAKRINKIAGDCLDSDSTVQGSMPAIGPNGEVYATWIGPQGLIFNRSLDSGDTWLNQEIFIDSVPGGWDFTVPGIYRTNGFAVIKCDLSGGPNHGTIYVNWSDQSNGIDDTDVWLVKSIDGGNTWSNKVRVNDDPPGKHQFFTWMDIDQTNGNLFFIFYDRRNSGGLSTDVFMASSTDGGNTFINNQLNDSSFTPNAAVFFGDYTNIVAHNNIVRPIWKSQFNGKSEIWTDISPIQKWMNQEENQLKRSVEFERYPNPGKDEAYVSFKLRSKSKVTLELVDINGKVIHTFLNNEEREFGIHVIPYSIQELNISPGTYYHRIYVNGKAQSLSTIIID